MAYNAILKLSGQGRTYESNFLISYNFDFLRRLDSVTLSAVGALEHFKVNLEVLSEGAEKDRTLFGWFISNFTDMEGSISLYSGGDKNSPLSKVIKFKHAKLFKFEENFDTHGTHPVSINLGIVAVTLDYADIEIDTTHEMTK